MIIMERKWREHVECVLRKDICMRRSKAVISTCIQGYISIRNIRNSHRPRPDTQLGRWIHINQCKRCLDANGLAFGAGTQPTLQKCLPPRSLSRPPSVTPSSTNTDNRHRCETKKEENEDWKTGSSISGKKNNNINKKKIQEKNTKRNTTTTENTQILICRHFSRY